MSLTLVIGGTRSGKSARGEALARSADLPVRYLATADPSDTSMAARVRIHAARRPPEWETVVATGELARHVRPDGITLLDGLGVWIARALESGIDVAGELDALVSLAGQRELIVVAEEAGLGLLPLEATARAWIDELGTATQRLAAVAERIELVVAGQPLHLGGGHGPVTPPPAELRRHGDTDRIPGGSDHAVTVLEPGPPPWLREALAAVLAGDEAGRYPDEASAIAATATLHGRGAAEVVPTNGAAEALWLLGPALRPRLAVCVHPAFTEAEAGLRVHGIPVQRTLRDSEAGFALDPSMIPEAADLVVLGNPVSPTGTLDPAASVLALRRPGRTIVVDEAFMGIVPGEPGSLAGEALEDVIVVRSLTKLLSIPGLRVGYALAPPRLARALRAVRPPWSAGAMALAAMRAAAVRPGELAAIAARAAAEREDLIARLAPLEGVRVWPSATNFCLVQVPDGPRVLARLRAHDIAVRPAASFPGLDERHLRITAREPERNAAFTSALAEALG